MVTTNANSPQREIGVETLSEQDKNRLVKLFYQHIIQIASSFFVSAIFFSLGGVFYGWAINNYPIIIISIISLVLSCWISYSFESTDLQDNDPLYSKKLQLSSHSQEKKYSLNTSEEIKTLLNDPGSAQITLETLQKNYKDLPEMEKYFSVLSPDSWENEYVRNVLKESVAETSSQKLGLCSDPVLIHELLKLSISPDIAQTDGEVKLLDKLVRAASKEIDQSLNNELRLGDQKKTLVILETLRNSNRSIKDLLDFFELVQWPYVETNIHLSQRNIITMVSALTKGGKPVPKEYHPKIGSLLKKVANTRVFQDHLIKSIDDQDFRKRVLEIGEQISLYDLDFANWFVNKELPGLKEDQELLKEFFPFMQRVIPQLKRNLSGKKYPDSFETFLPVLEYNWLNPDAKKTGYLPTDIADLCEAAFGNSNNNLGDETEQEPEEKQRETPDDGQNQNSIEEPPLS